MRPHYARRFPAVASGIALASGLACAQSGAAQTTATAAPYATATAADPGQVVVVTGIRNSLRSAQNIKKNSNEVVDSVVAQDIGKLPDPNLADSLQRVPGIQLYRYAGEGLYAIVRGLVDQNRTEYNGRSYFSAGSASGGGRDFEQDNALPELISGINVYKNPSAEHIEGAIGGLIDIRTYKPFDFKGFTAIGSYKDNDYDFARKTEPTVFGLVSNRWHTSVGEFGALFAAGYQKTAMRQDSIGTNNNNFTARPYLTYGQNLDGSGVVNTSANPSANPNDTVMAPNGFNEQLIYGGRTRKAFETALEWRPNASWRLYADGNYTDYVYDQDSYNISAGLASAGLPVSNLQTRADKTVITGADVASSGGTSPAAGTEVAGYDFVSGTYSGAQFNGLGDISINHFTQKQGAIGAEWHVNDRLDITGDFATTNSDNRNRYRSLNLETVPGAGYTVSQDLSGGTQAVSVAGGTVPLGVAGNWDFTTYNKQYTVQEENENALRFDLKYDLDHAWIFTQLKAGVRATDLTFNYDRANVTWNIRDANGTGNADLINVSTTNLWTQAFNNFWRNRTQGIGGFISFNRDILVNDSQIIADFPYAYQTINGVRVNGITAGDPAFDPTLTFKVAEKTTAGYVMANFETNIWVPVTGDVGVRTVKTEGTTFGYNTAPQSYDYINTLPSLNVKAHLTDNLLLRFDASKGVTRPPFASLNPSVIISNAGITLGGTPTATIGNNKLQAQKSDNLDLALEWYFSRTGYAYIDGFDKKVDGFITNFASLETLAGVTGQVLVTRPVNGGSGKIDGFETGFQTFFDRLPSPWDGIGVEANFTHVDSKQSVPLGPATAPVFIETQLANLSKNSYNLVAMYEKYGWTARLAYGYRSSYLRAQFGGGSLTSPTYSPNLPLVTPGYGSLDGSLSYDVNARMTVTLDAANITDSQPNRYANDNPLRPVQQYQYDRRFAVALRYKWGG